MKNCQHCEVYGIASINIEKAKWAADKLGIEKAYGSYEDLLDNKEIGPIIKKLLFHKKIAKA